MAKKIIYRPIEEFLDYYKTLVKRGTSFEKHQTTYTRQIIQKNENLTVIFNPSGERDVRGLTLINKVRSDADEFKAKTDFGEKRKDIKFFDIIETPSNNCLVSKVDINSAYWKTGLMKGVVKQTTDDLLKTLFTKDIILESGKIKTALKQQKESRLRALGSLATTKVMEYYHLGKYIPEATIVETRDTKGIYMDICGTVDTCMRECSREIEDCLYYYWDCMFIRKDSEKKAVEFFKSYGYESTTEHCTVEYKLIAGKYYLISTELKNGAQKQYMTRPEDFHTLNTYKER